MTKKRTQSNSPLLYLAIIIGFFLFMLFISQKEEMTKNDEKNDTNQTLALCGDKICSDTETRVSCIIDCPIQHYSVTEELINEIYARPPAPLITPTNNICEGLLVNSENPKDKINIMVVGKNVTYEKLKDLAKKAFFEIESQYVNGRQQKGSLFRAHNPYIQRISDFNIWLYPTLLPDSIRIDVVDAITNVPELKTARNSCPNNFVVIIYNNKTGSTATGRYYSQIKVDTTYYYHEINTARSISHEVGGHLIGGLGDEYISTNATTKYPYPIPNCDASQQCTKFTGIPTSGCFLGCSSQPNIYRSANSIMGGYHEAGFGNVSEYIINKRIDIQLYANKNS